MVVGSVSSIWVPLGGFVVPQDGNRCRLPLRASLVQDKPLPIFMHHKGRNA